MSTKLIKALGVTNRQCMVMNTMYPRSHDENTIEQYMVMSMRCPKVHVINGDAQYMVTSMKSTEVHDDTGRLCSVMSTRSIVAQ